jgi:hypothetical protein
MGLRKIYEDDTWVIHERNGNLRITLVEDNHYVEEISITPEMMKSKLMDTLKDLPEEIWDVKQNCY